MNEPTSVSDGIDWPAVAARLAGALSDAAVDVTDKRTSSEVRAALDHYYAAQHRRYAKHLASWTGWPEDERP
jgi:hypothetical protein